MKFTIVVASLILVSNAVLIESNVKEDIDSGLQTLEAAQKESNN